MDVAGEPSDIDDVLVVIGHPFGDAEVPLADWIATGPGPRRLVRPVRARSRSTGRPLPLSVVPLRYRNDGQSRRAIADGLVDDPWPDQET
ncbi:hypothetical protein Afe04nite_24800 [Asanoa ferruginea]|uniref:hypothetical protein n=1 Tax=Asanoa ferruginea TaxID=53367 RepID=UPI0011C1A635|nr:hypothetical protein [Asanoa ferruginea]GIF47941.1 hypothetical protein Afe04nite_24800 [Asanoa ferruginea]